MHSLVLRVNFELELLLPSIDDLSPQFKVGSMCVPPRLVYSMGFCGATGSSGTRYLQIPFTPLFFIFRATSTAAPDPFADGRFVG